MREIAQTHFSFAMIFSENAILDKTGPQVKQTGYAAQVLAANLDRRLNFPWRADLDSAADLIAIDVQLANGVLRILAGGNEFYHQQLGHFWAGLWGHLSFCSVSLLFLCKPRSDPFGSWPMPPVNWG